MKKETFAALLILAGVATALVAVVVMAFGETKISWSLVAVACVVAGTGLWLDEQSRWGDK